MRVQLPHQLTGYDRQTERVGVEYLIDPAKFKKIRKCVTIDPQDPDAIGSYPISHTQLRTIGDLMGQALDNDRYEFFLEPVGS